jgi:glutathione S-transferase
MLGHAAYMSNRLGCIADEMANLKAWIARIEARPVFVTGISA